jgi:hypothetical protein
MENIIFLWAQAVNEKLISVETNSPSPKVKSKVTTLTSFLFTFCGARTTRTSVFGILSECLTKKARDRVVSANAVRQNVKTTNGGRLVANPFKFPSSDRNPIANI